MCFCFCYEYSNFDFVLTFEYVSLILKMRIWFPNYLIVNIAGELFDCASEIGI